jgi:hypothetical protein
MQGSEKQDVDQKRGERDALAAERGDVSGTGRDITVTIREKDAVAPAQPPDPMKDGESELHLVLEGHKTTFGTDPNGDEDSDDDYLPSRIIM